MTFRRYFVFLISILFALSSQGRLIYANLTEDPELGSGNPMHTESRMSANSISLFSRFLKLAGENSSAVHAEELLSKLSEPDWPRIEQTLKWMVQFFTIYKEEHRVPTASELGLTDLSVYNVLVSHTGTQSPTTGCWFPSPFYSTYNLLSYHSSVFAAECLELFALFACRQSAYCNPGYSLGTSPNEVCVDTTDANGYIIGESCDYPQACLSKRTSDVQNVLVTPMDRACAFKAVLWPQVALLGLHAAPYIVTAAGTVIENCRVASEQNQIKEQLNGTESSLNFPGFAKYCAQICTRQPKQ